MKTTRGEADGLGSSRLGRGAPDLFSSAAGQWRRTAGAPQGLRRVCECCEVTPARHRVDLEGTKFVLCPGCEGLLLAELTR
jgi:hypothetical protein